MKRVCQGQAGWCGHFSPEVPKPLLSSCNIRRRALTPLSECQSSRGPPAGRARGVCQARASLYSVLCARGAGGAGRASFEAPNSDLCTDLWQNLHLVPNPAGPPGRRAVPACPRHCLVGLCSPILGSGAGWVLKKHLYKECCAV